MSQVGETNRTRFRKLNMKPLIEAGLMELTIPDKPTSSRQKYRTTEKGRVVLREMGGGGALETEVRGNPRKPLE